jgi:formylglycine-generating enzyme required for sulfatase activity
MVEVPSPAGGTYCIDSTEVTNAQYASFLTAAYPTSGQDAWCSWNTSYVPGDTWPATGEDDYPVDNVDWCDAYAFCKWAGKRLCGKIGGGANAPADSADATKSEWYAACSAGGTMTYPYGNTYSATACNGYGYGGGAPIAVGSEAGGCVGGYGGIHDMSGNVLEWEDSCDGTTGQNDTCLLRGGDPFSSAIVLSCGVAAGDSRSGKYHLGFRCCGD